MSVKYIQILSVEDVFQILTVLILFQDLIYLHDLLTADPAVQIGDFLKAGDLSVLVLFHSLYEICRVDQALVGTCIQPGESLTKKLNVQMTFFEIDPVEVCDLKLASG